MAPAQAAGSTAGVHESASVNRYAHPINSPESDDDNSELVMKLAKRATRRVNELLEDLIDHKERTMLESLRREELEPTNPRALN